MIFIACIAPRISWPAPAGWKKCVSEGWFLWESEFLYRTSDKGMHWLETESPMKKKPLAP